FFFQAEDGIRDFHVTGVQTCALPICGAGAGLAKQRVDLADTGQRGELARAVGQDGVRRRRVRVDDRADHQCGGGVSATHEVPVRSEERRVGKERRTPGTSYQYEKESE